MGSFLDAEYPLQRLANQLRATHPALPGFHFELSFHGFRKFYAYRVHTIKVTLSAQKARPLFELRFSKPASFTGNGKKRYSHNTHAAETGKNAVFRRERGLRKMCSESARFAGFQPGVQRRVGLLDESTRAEDFQGEIRNHVVVGRISGVE